MKGVRIQSDHCCDTTAAGDGAERPTATGTWLKVLQDASQACSPVAVPPLLTLQRPGLSVARLSVSLHQGAFNDCRIVWVCGLSFLLP